MDMVEIHRKKIIIQTDEGELCISFSPAQPRGYTELMRAVSGFDAMRTEAVQLSKGNRALAGAFVIDGELKALEAMKEAIRIALTPDEWAKLSAIIDYIDIKGMLEIATALLNSYVLYYNSRLEGLEE